MLDGKYAITKAEGGPWVIVGPDNRAVPTDDELYSHEHALVVLGSIARREGKTMDVADNSVPTIVRVSSETPPVKPAAAGPKPDAGPFFTRIGARVSPELSAMIQAMARDYDTSGEGVILLAIGLLKLANDARREGRRLAIVDADGEIYQEIDDV